MVGLAWWSQTASSNATQDSTVNWQEGQSPSSVNDSARAMMASTAKWRDDIAGAITTGGTSTAYTVTSYQSFDSLTRLNGQMIAFTPHATNNGTTTLNVDGLGAKPLRSAPSTEIVAGHLIQGTPYVAVYNNSDAVFYLHGFFGNPYMLPIGGVLPFAGATAPNSSFVLAYGQAISRTTYSSLFSLLGTTYGTGDGSTTFNVPDLRGRVIAGKDDMGGSAASRLTSSYFGTGATTLGGVGSSSESTTLTLAQLPTGITSANTGNIGLSVISADFSVRSPSNTTSSSVGGGTVVGQLGSLGAVVDRITSTGSITTGNAVVTSNNTSGNAHRTVQPTIILNYLLRII